MSTIKTAHVEEAKMQYIRKYELLSVNGREETYADNLLQN